MEHQHYRENLSLLLYGEIGKSEEAELREHMKSCPSCAKEYEELEMLFSTIDSAKFPKASEPLLDEARMELRAALRLERSKHTWKDIWTERIQGWLPIFRLTFASLASLALGIFIGYKAITPINPGATEKPVAQKSNGPEIAGDTQITNVKFQDSDTGDGQIEFTFEAVRPMKYKGNINNPSIQKVLTYALVNEQNPGVRLHAVSALNTKRSHTADPQVKTALIEALTKDENPGVRHEALTALQKFDVDEDIKKAYLHVLVHDTNPGLRVEAIKSMENERLMDQEVVSVLKGMQTDENEFVRLNAKRLVQEVSQKQ
jgi:HEAT repeat protein/putative zinc finger protein